MQLRHIRRRPEVRRGSASLITGAFDAAVIGGDDAQGGEQAEPQGMRTQLEGEDWVPRVKDRLRDHQLGTQQTGSPPVPTSLLCFSLSGLTNLVCPGSFSL